MQRNHKKEISKREFIKVQDETKGEERKVHLSAVDAIESSFRLFLLLARLPHLAFCLQFLI